MSAYQIFSIQVVNTIGMKSMYVKGILLVAVTVYATPDCNLIINSPQFAILCNLTNVTLPLSTIPGLGLSGVPLNLQSLSADAVCDLDCRCVMGATKGGGKCGMSNGKAICQCDYNPKTPTPSTNTTTDLCELFVTPLNICAAQGTGTDNLFNLQRLCDADCTCSHGYPSNPSLNKCKNQTVSGNAKNYCFCNNGTNLPSG